MLYVRTKQPWRMTQRKHTQMSTPHSTLPLVTNQIVDDEQGGVCQLL